MRETDRSAVCSSQSSDIDASDELRHFEHTCNMIVHVAVVLSESYRCLSVSEVVAIVAEAVPKIAIRSIPRGNYAILTF